MPPVSFLRRPTVLLFLFVCVVAAAFALHTNHVWEDYYITYRSSKHLATGDGLVHNVGERLHTFTSPLGVLLPAAASLLTFNSSDTGALWIFRGMTIAALGIAAVLLFRSSRELGLPLAAALFLVVGVATDAKTVDFTINGMETPIVIAFFAYAFWAMLGVTSRRWLHLGLAWAGLMWSRPDGCIVIAILTVAVWVFNDPARSGLTRAQWLPVLLRAAGVTTVLYLPWFLWAWSYYGTPVPHTITAKAMLGGAKSLEGFWLSLLAFPARINSYSGAIDAIFAPPNMFFGGWPEAPRLFARMVAAGCAALWLVGGLHQVTRALSLTYFGLCVYLNYFPPFPAAWYLSLPSTVALFALACALSQLFDLTRGVSAPRYRYALQALVVLPAAGFILQGGWFTFQAARQLKAQQTLIENGLRRPIGEWLRDNAAPGDTVFLEPLGYIGFFSGLRTYDFPGLSSPEMVDAIRRLGPKYPPLIRDLKPTWLALRPVEIARVQKEDPGLLQTEYAPVRTFDASREVSALTVQGLSYIANDQTFVVFRRR
jgi:hypothetical protein